MNIINNNFLIQANERSVAKNYGKIQQLDAVIPADAGISPCYYMRFLHPQE